MDDNRQTKTWIGKDAPSSLSKFLNLINEPIFLYNKDPQNFMIDFVINLDFSAKKSTLEMRTNFQDVERVVNERISKVFEELSKRCRNHPTENFAYEDEYTTDTKETDVNPVFENAEKTADWFETKSLEIC